MAQNSMNREAGRGFPGRRFQRGHKADLTGTRQQIGAGRRNQRQSKEANLDNERKAGYPGINGNNQQTSGREILTRFFAYSERSNAKNGR